MKTLFKVRWLTIAAVAFGLIGAALMFVIGSVSTIDSIGLYLGFQDADAFSSTAALAASVVLIGALDQFLLGLVLLVFAYGVFELFVVADSDQLEAEFAGMSAPEWLKINSVTDLKVKLLEVIIVLLAVLVLKGVLVTPEVPWTGLVIPITVLLFGLTVWLIKKAH